MAEGSFQTTILNGVGRGHEGSDQTTGNKPFSDETGSTNAIEFYINSLRMRLIRKSRTIEKRNRKIERLLFLDISMKYSSIYSNLLYYYSQQK